MSELQLTAVTLRLNLIQHEDIDTRRQLITAALAKLNVTATPADVEAIEAMAQNSQTGRFFAVTFEQYLKGKETNEEN